MILEGKQLVSIYLLLKKYEESLDINQQSVLHTIEKEIFSYLSIEEIESIDKLYEKKVDILDKKK